MKDNYITLKDKKGVKKEYKVLLNIMDTSNNVNYLVYSDETKKKNGSYNVYASTYIYSEVGNMTKFKSVCMKEEFDFIEKILNSLEEKE